MRIAQIAPLYEGVPPRFYGGTERVVSFLTEELVRQGHDVTLFASGDSVTSAELVPVCERGLRLDPNCRDPLPYHVLQMQKLMERAQDFDLVHFHSDYIHFPLLRAQRFPNLTTLHCRLDSPELSAFFREYSEQPVVSISNSQRTPVATANWAGTVYHGLPKNLLEFHGERGKYLAFIGRISSEKRPDRAIAMAIRAGLPLKMAAKISETDRPYYREKIAPLLNHPLIEFVGEIGEAEKSEFLGNAMALLFPVDWPEPFGLVMIEALACGTPVIAFNSGSVPEIIENGTTGFIVNDLEEGQRAIENISSIDRSVCRKIFEERFSAERMVSDYLRIYGRISQYHKSAIRSRSGKFEPNSEIARIAGDDLYSSELTVS